LSEFGSEVEVEVSWYDSGPGVRTPWYTIEPYYEESDQEAPGKVNRSFYPVYSYSDSD